MTMILSCITEEQAFQVSDRRLTLVKPDGTTEVAEDDRNKAVVFDGRLAWAFTGLAQIQREPSAEWLAKRLKATSKVSLSELGEELADHASVDFKRIPVSSDLKRHAFVAVGWWPADSDTRAFEPVIVRVSNMFDNAGRLQATASETFKTTVSKPEDSVTILPSGQPVLEDQLSRLRRNLKASMKHDALQASGDLLVREVLGIASANEYVGSNVLLISLPRAALDESGRFFFINQRPSPKVATYWYVSSTDDAQKSPIVVGSGISDLVIHRGAAALREIKCLNLPKPRPWRYLILTPWTGTGSDDDPRRGLVTEYQLVGAADVTRALVWGKEYDCPYFGLIIGANANETVVKQIRADERHLILADRLHVDDQVPDGLVTQLEHWFLNRDAIREDLDVINLEGYTDSLIMLIDRLLAVMRTRRRGHEKTKLHEPPRGGGTGIVMPRKYQVSRSSGDLAKDP